MCLLAALVFTAPIAAAPGFEDPLPVRHWPRQGRAGICIVEGIRQNKLGLAKYIVDDAGKFDPAHPVPMPDDFKIPLVRPAALVPGRGRGGQ